MAAGAEEKTEEATAKKKSDARNKGNIAKSKDMSAALDLLAAIYLLRLIGPYMAGQMLNFVQKIIHEDLPYLAMPERKEILPLALDWCLRLGIVIAPFLLLMCVAAYLIGYVQVGFLVTFEQLKLNLNKLNPVAGFKRIFSTRNLVMLAMNLAKFMVIMTVAWWTVITELRNVIVMVEMEARGTFIYATDKVLSLAERLAYILLALGLIDYYYQKWKHSRDLRMTKQEVKEEFKQMEGDPKVKQKRRQKQMEAAMRRMMGEVPQAEVVVRNPTHFAVAISYKPGMELPVVLAKGQNKNAEKIIQTALEARVPVVENPPLARQLFKMCEVGDVIPADLFNAVAEILATVLPMEKKRRLMEAMQPAA
ncbi:MAG: flagellar biosynthesis protein FlhB [Planctomycetes bacterium]|nr:flagellar biosynthesis protein FlhB [Planctomycetota bacterium]